MPPPDTVQGPVLPFCASQASSREAQGSASVAEGTELWGWTRTSAVLLLQAWRRGGDGGERETSSEGSLCTCRSWRGEWCGQPGMLLGVCMGAPLGCRSGLYVLQQGGRPFLCAYV